MTSPYPPAQPSPEQLRAVNEAQSPEEYRRAAQDAGLTGEAEGFAAAGARPQQVDANELLKQIQSLQAQVSALQQSQPARQHPVAARFEQFARHWEQHVSAHRGTEFGALVDDVASLGRLIAEL